MTNRQILHSSLRLLQRTVLRTGGRTCDRIGARTISTRSCCPMRTCALSSASCYRTVPDFSSVQSSSYHTTSSLLNEHIFNVQDEADYTERVTKNETPVIVDFHASWCGPCKLLGPRLETLIASKKGKVLLAKIDIDEMTELAVNHGVEAVPTVIAMKDGKVIDKFVGLKDDADLETFIQKLID